jgi:zinc transporter ZupT
MSEIKMDISRRLGILVFCAVPAIVGGGIVYAIFGSLTPMWIYEVLLLVVAGALVSR